MAGDIVGILLAAGYGRRYGSDKRQARLADGTPLAIAAAGKLRAACDRVIVVVRPEDQALAADEGYSQCEILFSATAHLGMGHSLAAGVAAAPQAAGWLIALADMPYIQPSTYRAVVAALRSGATLAQPSHQGRPGHPVGFAASWRAQLIALTGDDGARRLVGAAGEARLLCAVDDTGIHRDIDRPADLAGMMAVDGKVATPFGPLERR